MNRDITYSKTKLLLPKGYSTVDDETMESTMDMAKQGSSLCKGIQAWYNVNINKKCGVRACKDSMHNVLYATKEFV